MNSKNLLKEYDLEIDDVRYYLSRQMAERLVSHKEAIDELIKIIWSGTLADELYDMEERFLENIDKGLQKGESDEAQIREIFFEIDVLRRNRD